MSIEYRTGNDLDLDEVIDLYRVSTLGERRPVDDQKRMAQMITEANLVITAWDCKETAGARMVGIARSLSDFTYCTYLSDLAVRVSYQKQGIGVELVRRTQQAAPQATLILLSAPAAEKYYPRIGMTNHPQCWILKPGQELKLK